MREIHVHTKHKLCSVLMLILFFMMVPVSSGMSDNKGDDVLKRVVIATNTPDVLYAMLESMGVDVLSKSMDTVDVVVSDRSLAELEKMGFNIIDIIPGRPLNDIIAQSNRAVPNNYKNLDQINTYMQTIAAQYPAIAEYVDLTHRYNAPPTSENRHIYALKISDNVTADEDEPSLLVVSAHHCREIVTPVIALHAMEQLTANYGIDAAITNAVDNNEIWIAPVWNPDGYNYVFTTNNMWRKNRRRFADGTGVDLNRNYPFGWDSACSGSTTPGSDTFKGSAPGSEAETQIMTAWADAEHFAKVLDFHSSGRKTLYGSQCMSNPFSIWMGEEAAALSTAAGYAGAVSYPSAAGENFQWHIGNNGSLSFLVQTARSFQPSYAEAQYEAQLVWPGIMHVLERPISVSGHVRDSVTGEPLEASIEITNVLFDNGEKNRSYGPYGRYHIFLPEGTFTILFSRSGYTSKEITVNVTASSADIFDIALVNNSLSPVPTRSQPQHQRQPRMR